MAGFLIDPGPVANTDPGIVANPPQGYQNPDPGMVIAPPGDQNDLAAAIKATAARLGVNPIDIGTAISYETAGTFDPWKAGPTTQWGQHRGLIQWGEPQRREFGVYQGMPNAEQMQAVGRYLEKAGVRPGMGLLDIYSAINAGQVGRYNASDAGNGGAPGTVADKVRDQMAAHRQKAAALLGGSFSPIADAAIGRPAGQPATFGALPQMAAAGLPGADPFSGLAAQFGAPKGGAQQAAAQEADARRQALLSVQAPIQTARPPTRTSRIGAMFG